MLKLNKISSIHYIENAKVDSRRNNSNFNSFIVIEDVNGEKLVYNITTGEDHSFDKSMNLALYIGYTKILTFYENDGQSYNNKIEVGKINNINIYKSSSLKNIYTNEIISNSDYLVFNYNDKKIIVDYINNKLYINNNTEIISKDKNNINIFKINKEGKSIYKYLMKRIRFLKFINIFFEVQSE